MAKNPQPPPQAGVSGVEEALFTLGDLILGDHFFDEDNENAYKKLLSKRQPQGTAGVPLLDMTFETTTGNCSVVVEALRQLTFFRFKFTHADYAATIEGAWNFEQEELINPKLVSRLGDLGLMEADAEDMIQQVEGSGLDEEEFADFMAELEDDDETSALIGDDPAEPPEPTSIDRNRVKSIAKQLAKARDDQLTLEDRGWLEQTPQSLPLITENLVAALNTAKRDESLISAYQAMLSLQLEYVRYRLDRGWDWAKDMLESYQDRLIELAETEAVPQADWFVMCGALSEAKVPVAEDVKVALANAGFMPNDLDEPPEEMMASMRGFLDQLGQMVSSPFEVVEALQATGAVLPPQLRSFLATELALSPHAILRDAVPVMLLDTDAPVRQSAAGALDQTAHPETMSSASLRRAIAVRNWIPAGNRPPLDAAIRKARVAGVEISAWPAPVADLEFYASTIDGSGAQSILTVSRSGKTGLFGGLLLRHGTGVIDTWADRDLSRGKIGKSLKEAQMSAPFSRVDKPFVDIMVQHAIACSVAADQAPPALLLDMAELLGGAEWQDRQLDVAGEAERMFAALDPADRSEAGIQAGFARGLEWMAQDEIFNSWFEDGPAVQKALAKLPRTDKLGMTSEVMTRILPEKRQDWAERFLIMAMWSEASAEARQRARTKDLVLVAHALAGDAPLETIPFMAVIAMQTVRSTLLGGW